MAEKQITEETKEKKQILQPKNDVVFQALFTRGKESITKALIEDILNIKVHSLELDKSKDLLNENTEDKNGRLDLRAVINDNIECDIEIQLSSHEKMLERFLYYWSKMYAANLQIGDKYSCLKKTISIIILDDEIEDFKEITKSHTKWQIREEEYLKKILTPYLQIDIIELPKAIKEYEKNKQNEMLQWMMFLENPENKEVANIMKNNENIKEAKDELEKISQDDILRRMALKAELERMDHEQLMYEARRDGKAEGKEEGKKEGIKEGIKKGIKENQLEIAKKMLKEKMQIDIIEKFTGLTKEEIMQIK